MRQRDRFLARLYARAAGRIDRTLHAHRHIGHPLGLSPAEMERSTHDLIALGLIEADPGFDRLIRLTPAGVAAGAEACAILTATGDREEQPMVWRGFAVSSAMYEELAERALLALTA